MDIADGCHGTLVAYEEVIDAGTIARVWFGDKQGVGYDSDGQFEAMGGRRRWRVGWWVPSRAGSR